MRQRTKNEDFHNSIIFKTIQDIENKYDNTEKSVNDAISLLKKCDPPYTHPSSEGNMTFHHLSTSLPVKKKKKCRGIGE